MGSNSSWCARILIRLQTVGMGVEQTSPVIGVISGSLESDHVNCLYQIEGVQDIESKQNYQLAPQILISSNCSTKTPKSSQARKLYRVSRSA